MDKKDRKENKDLSKSDIPKENKSENKSKDIEFPTKFDSLKKFKDFLKLKDKD
jgi:hypothetical protein